MGESVLVAGDLNAVKIHIHNERPDEVIGYGLSIGSLSRINVENLDRQAQERRQRAAAMAPTAAANGKGPPLAMSGFVPRRRPVPAHDGLTHRPSRGAA